MKRYDIAFTPRADADLLRIKRYMEKRFGTVGAERFTQTILDDCLALANAPQRGIARPRLGPNVRRIGGADGRVSLLFKVEEDIVTILSVRYAGRR